MNEVCKYHPDRKAIVHCYRCNAPLCRECIAYRDGDRYYCKKCFDYILEEEYEKEIEEIKIEVRKKQLLALLLIFGLFLIALEIYSINKNKEYLQKTYPLKREDLIIRQNIKSLVKYITLGENLVKYKDKYGKYPDNLYELTIAFPKIDTIDIISNKGFIYEKKNNGFILSMPKTGSRKEKIRVEKNNIYFEKLIKDR
ncbi:hypothetical protein DRP44_02455 [candidate division TA06 bacterium]|uniref:B box-type domain-containing protein n=1 Tax=candidate division TA06 bacterium TaxID=2250710 RepID=A0A660SA13_UNCT6|nr:MAG: hypothetical protein DRP44_02455 [candidate division TA06 bacterium]